MTAVIDELRDHDAGRVEVTLEKLCLTADEAAQVLSVGRTTIYELLSRGELASISIGRSRRIPLSSLKAYVAAELERSGPARVCATSASDPASPANGRLPATLGAFSGATTARAGTRRRGS